MRELVSDRRDGAVERALSRRSELISELQQIDTFLTLYRKFSESSDDGRTTGDTPTVVNANPSVPEDIQSTGSFHGTSSFTAHAEVVKPKGMKQSEFVEFVRTLLLENGAPMLAPEIIRRFRDKGRHIGGTNEASNLKTKLWRAKDQITTVPGAGYWPIDVPCDAVSYKPQLQEQVSDH
jgi:hypothetical protein